MRLRSPFERIAGCLWLARLTDKARLKSQGELPSDYMMLLGHPRGIDGCFLRHFELEKETTLECLASLSDDSTVEHWFQSQPGVGNSSIRSWNHLAPNLGKSGWPGEENMPLVRERFFAGVQKAKHAKSFFELILIDEELPETPRKDSLSA